MTPESCRLVAALTAENEALRATAAGMNRKITQLLRELARLSKENHG